MEAAVADNEPAASTAVEENADSSEDEEESGEEESDEEEEPKLKYQRVGLSVAGILRRDTASCVACSTELLVLGTRSGSVYILDQEGRELNGYHPHTAAVNAISISREGFIGTAADDGVVHIRAINGKVEPQAHSYGKPITALALEPLYGSAKGNNRFVCGGTAGELLVHKDSWFGQKDEVLHSKEGPIRAASWEGSLIAWANDLGVKIYDTALAQKISFIQRPRNAPPPSICRCHLTWENPNTLAIGWGTSIQMIGVPPLEPESDILPTRC